MPSLSTPGDASPPPDGDGRPPPAGGVAVDARAAARGGASLLVLQTAARLVSVAFALVVTRQLLPAEFGRYSTVAAVVIVANFLADFGTSAAITRMVSREPAEGDALLAGTLPFSFLLGLVSYAGVVAFGVVAYSSETAADLALGGLAIPAASMQSSLLGTLDGVGLIARRALVSTLQTAVVSAGAIPVLLGGGVRSAMVALALAPWVGLVVAARTARRAGLLRSWSGPDTARMKALLRSALPFALSGGMTALVMRFDVILLSVVAPPAETASYDLALRLLEAATYLSTALGSPLLYILSRRLGQGDRDGARRAYGEAVRAMYLLGLPLSVGAVVLAGPLVQLAFGAEFRSVATPFAILGAGQWLAFVVVLQGVLMMAGDFVGRGMRVAGGITGLAVALDLALVPRFGPTGAAAVMVVVWAVGVVAQDRFHRRTVGIATPLPSAGALVSTAALGAAVFALRGQPLAVPVLVGGLVYAAALVLTRTLTAADVRRLRSVLRSR